MPKKLRHRHDCCHFKTKQIAKWIQKKKEIFKILKKPTNPYLLLLLQLLLLSVESRRFELSQVESNRVITQPSNISE